MRSAVTWQDTIARRNHRLPLTDSVALRCALLGWRQVDVDDRLYRAARSRRHGPRLGMHVANKCFEVDHCVRGSARSARCTGVTSGAGH
jgi:hypothetical protein